eukprot:scpid55219/ scgid9823/ 
MCVCCNYFFGTGDWSPQLTSFAVHVVLACWTCLPHYTRRFVKNLFCRLRFWMMLTSVLGVCCLLSVVLAGCALPVHYLGYLFLGQGTSMYIIIQYYFSGLMGTDGM